LPSTARTVAKRVGINDNTLDLYDPALNIQLGTAYLQSLFAMFGGDQFRAVAAYNAGEHAVERWNARHSGEADEWVENIGYKETRDYVKKVIGGRREYQLLYGSGSNAAKSPTTSQSRESTWAKTSLTLLSSPRAAARSLFTRLICERSKPNRARRLRGSSLATCPS
ncbi:MAG: transglycosylase SLT domain-containing protein, partial [Candidatus Binataceae bacterium]